MTRALVIGGGPAGLMAAETLADAGVTVTLADKMPSLGRKFLMAGKSGLNITKTEDESTFLAAYLPRTEQLAHAISDFGPDAVQDWALGLGQSIFTGSTGRVFPEVMKASPLLRAWLQRLVAKGVTFHTRWNWQGWDKESAALFATPAGPIRHQTDITILALGGASWARLGSDGAWSSLISGTTPFQPANVGFRRRWSEHMTRFIGHPVKGIALTAGDLKSRGEIVLSAEGLEGGGIYEVSRVLREGAPLQIDLLPDLETEKLLRRWAGKRAKETTGHFLKSTLRLPAIKVALFQEVFQTLVSQDVPAFLKALPLSHDGPREMDQAISTAGGVRFDALDDNLMLNERPGVFCAGEMLDWEAPTGGYLITGSLATGKAAALGALNWNRQTNP
ncbi:hypothetical protein SAMN04488515_3273 [Cognatiyoonia koreensis]|uniref:TIGR03862 family flavoprotein n=1 Tax=Cognatiyoonia koreensis TaxID=364200 RepID=A0A1I0RUI8_9RHOB|nr:TIGR03862 family flavoprotein [Cognatiyoonia koreensis]SEW45010.1 hypothetical protein SAMN04488515_3273 [Cognatiyoonia koreensis]